MPAACVDCSCAASCCACCAALSSAGWGAAASDVGVLPAADMGQSDKSGPAAALVEAKGNPLVISPKFTCMPCKAESVIFCTSSACTVAASALLFCSSQNCTALSSSMRLLISSTLSVGATQFANGGCAALPCPTLPRLCKNSNPGMNLPKPNAEESLIAITHCVQYKKSPGTAVYPGWLPASLTQRPLYAVTRTASAWLKAANATQQTAGLRLRRCAKP